MLEVNQFVKSTISIKCGCFEGKKSNPRNITEKNISLFTSNNHFCLIWESNTIIFNQAIEELKLNFKVVDNVISDKHIKSPIKFEYDRKKINLQKITFCV